MISEPTIEQRDQRHYAGIRTEVPAEQLPTTIPNLIREVFGWLAQHGVAPDGAPLIRYHTINMPSALDIEIGVPVRAAVQSNGRIGAGTLPAGRYAALVYTGPYDGLMQANAALIDWARDHGYEFDRWDAPTGDAFAGRYESYLTDPEEEADPAKWRTEVAIRLTE